MPCRLGGDRTSAISACSLFLSMGLA